MVAVDDIILAHARAPYDPVKRRDYYLRTRQLKGRKVGTTQTPSGRKVGTAKPPPKGDPRKAQKLRREKRRHEIDAKVTALRERLVHLQDLLVQLVRQAKIRSGVKPTVKAPPRKSATAGSKDRTTSEKSTTPEKRTVTEKREAAKRSKDYYDKNVKGHGPSKSTEIRRLKSKIEDTEQMIDDVRKDLKASIARARKKVSQTKPAAKSRQTSKKGNDQNGS